MPAAKERRRRRSPAERRELILGGAMRSFAERGYERASMGEIAREAGITPAVIYDHFDSKAELAIALLEREADALLHFVAAALDAAPRGQAAQMRAGVEAFFRYVEQHRFAWRLLFRDPPADPAVAAAYRELNGRATAAIAVFLRSGDSGALAEYGDPERAAEMFAEGLKAAQNGLAAWWYEHPEVPRAEVVERLLELAWTGLERVAGGAESG
jgi:AcrR family transcriptional regulator